MTLPKSRPLAITWFNSRKDSAGKRAQTDFNELVSMAQNPVRGQETMEQYHSFPKAKQDELKDVGAFVAATFKADRRKASNVQSVSMLVLDCDKNVPADLAQRLHAMGCCFILYPTRKSTPFEPRYRAILPLDQEAEPEMYAPLGLAAANYIDPTLQMFDPVSFRAGQLMYKPSCCVDSDYQAYFSDGPCLSRDGLLRLYTDWQDASQWPQVPGAEKEPKRLAAKQGDPTEKDGGGGAFCRCYDVLQAMDKFLPSVYEPVPGFDDR